MSHRPSFSDDFEREQFSNGSIVAMKNLGEMVVQEDGIKISWNDRLIVRQMLLYM